MVITKTKWQMCRTIRLTNTIERTSRERLQIIKWLQYSWPAGCRLPYKGLNLFRRDLNWLRAPDRKKSRLSINYFLLLEKKRKKAKEEEHTGNWEEAGFKTGTCEECLVGNLISILVVESSPFHPPGNWTTYYTRQTCFARFQPFNTHSHLAVCKYVEICSEIPDVK